MDAVRSVPHGPMLEFESDLKTPEPFHIPECKFPDLSKIDKEKPEIDFNDLMDFTSSLTEQGKRFASFLDFSGAVAARAVFSYYQISQSYEKVHGNLSLDQLGQAQTARNCYILHFGFLTEQAHAIDQIAQTVLQTREWLTRVLDHKVITDVTKEVAKGIQSQITGFAVSIEALQLALKDRIGSANQKIYQLVLCLDSNKGGPITMLQGGQLRTMGRWELTLHEEPAASKPPAASASQEAASSSASSASPSEAKTPPRPAPSYSAMAKSGSPTPAAAAATAADPKKKKSRTKDGAQTIAAPKAT